MLIKTKYIDCASKSVFNTWKLPTSAADTSGDIYWSAIVYIQDTGEVWTHGKLYGGFFSNADSNKVSLTIGGTTKILALDGHVQSYTTLTGSGTTADQAILSTGVANKWTLKTLGKNAFSNVDYLPADATAVAAEKVVNAMRFQYNGKDMHSFDGSVARLLNIIQGDNVFITGDSQGNVTIAADPGSDTVNTAGATNLIDKKLFLIGAESQTTSPQTYSNQYVYIGTDNCLYSLGKKVLTEHQAIYNLDLQTQVGDAVTKVTTFDPNAANNSFTLVQGTNVTLIPDATNKKVTISSKDTTYDFYNLIFKQGDTVVDTYKPTTSPNKSFKAGTNVTFTKSGDEITVTTQDTRNTAGATEKLATKLFLTGSLTQTDNPQTYTNSKVYIGADNKLYSDGKVVSTGDHTHNYAGATTPGGPALKVDLNPSGLLDATYGSYGGLLQDSNKGPVSGSWSNRIKILHNNTQGFYTELAQNFTGTAGLWHRRCNAGSVSSWTPVIDNANFHTYLDGTYIQKGTDPNQLTNYVRYSLASGLTIYWAPADVTPTQVLGFKSNDSSKAYTFSGANIRAFANAVNKSGDTMTGTLTVSTKGTGAYNQGIRINRTAADQWATLTIGNVGTGTSGTSDNTWLIGTPGNSNSLIFNRNSANESSGLCLKGHGNTDMKWNNNTVWHAGNDGSGSGLDADKLDNYNETAFPRLVGIKSGTWNWNDLTRAGYYKIQSGTVTNHPSGVYQFGMAEVITTENHADGENRELQIYYPHSQTNNIAIWLRMHNSSTQGNGWGNWVGVPNVNGNIASSTKSDYPTGFSNRSTSSTWGNTTGTHITGWGTSTGGAIAFMNDNPSAGKVSIKIDGLFYQDEGKYKVLDTNNYSATLDGRYLRIGETATSGTNSKYLSFANNAGGVGGTMGDNDQWRIYARSTAANAGYLEIATADDGNEPIYFRQYTGVFSTLKRTLTLLDGSGNTSMPGSLSVTGTTTSGNFNTGGRYISNFSSGTWINSVTNAVLTCNYTNCGGIINAPTKGGRITIATYPNSDNVVYLGYATSAQISAGTNAFNRQARWNADNGFLYATGHVKDGSSDSYVLLGGGGHATLSGLGGSHTHTIFRNNLMIKGTNGISDSASIHLGIGDSDTGFKWISDGVAQIYANNTAIGQWNSTCMNWYKTPQVNGVAVSLTGHTHNYITSSGLRTATANGNTRGESGVRLYAAYNNGYPTTYGTVLHLHEGRGAAELLLGWSGTDGAHANNYVRSKRDNDSGAWSGWATIYTTANLDINNLTAKYLVNVAGISNLDSPNWYSNGDGYGISMNSYNGSASNQPSGGDNANSVLNICNTKHGTSGVYGWQIAFENHNILVRKWSAGSKTGWYTLWHSGNSNISDALLKSGGTMTGALNFANNTWNKVGDDVYIGDHNIANYLCIKANSGTTAGINFFNSSDGDIGKLTSANGTLQWKGTNVSLNGHTHDFINSKGNLNAQTGRTQNLGNVYSYNTVSGNTGGPTTYTSIIGFGRGAAGTVEIAGGWTSSMGLWYRALRDVTDNWFGWVKVWDTKNFNPGDYAQLSRLKKARVPGEVIDFYVYRVGSYYATNTDYTTFKNQLFDSSGRGKSSVTYYATYSNQYTVDLSDFVLCSGNMSGYSNGAYMAGAGELETNRVGQSAGANSKTISGLEMPKHAHWFGRYRSDDANDRNVFGPDGNQNWSTNGTNTAGQGGNWRTGYSGSGSAKDWRPKTIFVFKMIYAPQSW